MCQSDVSVFTFKKFPELEEQGIEGEWPDFEINHMCRISRQSGSGITTMSPPGITMFEYANART